MRRVAGAVAVLSVAALALPAPGTAAEAGSLAGGVRDRAGEPLPGAEVTVLPEGCHGAAGELGCPEPRTVTTTTGGLWEVTGVPPGSYHVHVTDPSGEHADQWWDGQVDPVEAVAVGAGEQRGGLELRLETAALVAGRVRGPGGEPLQGAAARTARTPFSIAEAVTDEDGRFELGGLAGRTYDIEVSAPEGDLGEVSATVVLADGAAEELDVALPLLGLRLVRVAGGDRVATAVAASREAFPSAGSVVLASAGSFPDALAAAPLAAALGGPLLLTGPSLPGAVAEEIGRLAASEVVVVGAVGAVPLLVQEQLGRLGVEVRRVPGETRFDTAALLGREVAASPRAGEDGGDGENAEDGEREDGGEGEDGEDGGAGEDGEGGEARAREVVLASGGAFPDALSVAPLAAAEGLPILLSAASSLVGDTRAVLAELDPERVLVVGGESAISGAVAAELPGVTRLAGPERYATSVAVAEEFLRRGADLGVTYVATGSDFPDALAAGPVAARTRGPVLLVDGAHAGRSPASLEFVAAHGSGIRELWVFGGTAAVGEATVARLRQARGEP